MDVGPWWLLDHHPNEGHPCAQVRLAGDRYVLVEYGPMELDLNLRVRVWELQAHLAAARVGLLTSCQAV
jgi:urea carboxylase